MKAFFCKVYGFDVSLKIGWVGGRKVLRPFTYLRSAELVLHDMTDARKEHAR